MYKFVCVCVCLRRWQALPEIHYHQDRIKKRAGNKQERLKRKKSQFEQESEVKNLREHENEHIENVLFI